MIEVINNKLIRVSEENLRIIGSSEIHYSEIISETDSEIVIDLRGVEFVLGNTDNTLNVFNTELVGDCHIDSVLRFHIPKLDFVRGLNLFVLGFINNNMIDEIEFYTDYVYIELMESRLHYRSCDDYLTDCHEYLKNKISTNNNLNYLRRK